MAKNPQIRKCTKLYIFYDLYYFKQFKFYDNKKQKAFCFLTRKGKDIEAMINQTRTQVFPFIFAQVNKKLVIIFSLQGKISYVLLTIHKC